MSNGPARAVANHLDSDHAPAEGAVLAVLNYPR